MLAGATIAPDRNSRHKPCQSHGGAFPAITILAALIGWIVGIVLAGGWSVGLPRFRRFLGQFTPNQGGRPFEISTRASAPTL